jgi:hypothetical protein
MVVAGCCMVQRRLHGVPRTVQPHALACVDPACYCYEVSYPVTRLSHLGVDARLSVGLAVGARHVSVLWECVGLAGRHKGGERCVVCCRSKRLGSLTWRRMRRAPS